MINSQRINILVLALIIYCCPCLSQIDTSQLTSIPHDTLKTEIEVENNLFKKGCFESKHTIKDDPFGFDFKLCKNQDSTIIVIQMHGSRILWETIIWGDIQVSWPYTFREGIFGLIALAPNRIEKFYDNISRMLLGTMNVSDITQKIGIEVNEEEGLFKVYKHTNQGLPEDFLVSFEDLLKLLEKWNE